MMANKVNFNKSGQTFSLQGLAAQYSVLKKVDQSATTIDNSISHAHFP